MALDANLQSFKSSGVYRLEFDKSQTVGIPAETIRLVVGFSKKGPFNTPVFVPSTDFFLSVFGDVDRSLERKGSFFHRMAKTCLSRGPIIVLNLLDLDDTLDKTDFASLAASPDPLKQNKAVAAAPLSGYYNQDKFWFLDSTEVIRNVKTIYPANNNILNVANVGRKPISAIVRKSRATGFDVTAEEWYGTSNIPEFMHSKDLISDYMIEVTIVQGDYSDYAALDIDPIFGDYFDSKGLTKEYTDSFGSKFDGLDAFLNLDQVSVLGRYTGSIIPDFVDKQNNNLFIEDLVNLESTATGAILAIDKDKFDSYLSGDIIDLVGHQIESENPSTFKFLSYTGTIKANQVYDKDVTLPYTFSAGATASSTASHLTGATASAFLTASSALQAASVYSGGTHFDTVKFYGPDSAEVNGGYPNIFGSQSVFTAFSESLKEGQSYLSCSSTTGSINRARVKSKVSTTNDVTLQIEIDDAGTVLDGDTNFMFLGDTSVITVVPEVDYVDAGSSQELYAFVNSSLYEAYNDGTITSGDSGLEAGGTAYYPAKFTKATLSSGTDSSTIDASMVGIFSHDLDYVKVELFEEDTFDTLLTAGFDSTASDYTIQTLTGDINQTFSPVLDRTADAVNVVRISGTVLSTSDIKTGDYLVSELSNATTSKSRLTRVNKVAFDSSANIYTITCDDTIYNNGATGSVERYKDIEEFVTNYNFHKLGGYTLRDAQLPNGTVSRQNELLDVIYNTNLRRALTDREQITYRYVIDTFEGTIEGSSKSRLSKLAKDYQSAFAIVNTPSADQFSQSTDPLFKFDSTSKFDPQYVATGGNQSLNPQNTFSLPGIGDGSNYCAFYGPSLKLREKGATILVPPAAHVSNLYIDKYTTAYPWSIIAGPRRGVVSGPGIVGVEYQFDRVDLDFVEPFGYNAIVPKRGFGLVINANQTAQQNIKSALSQAHVRELIIYIQEGIEAILKNYRWEFNNAQNRLEIKTLADNFLGGILSNGGLNDFRNIMDTTNNTNEIIDSNIGILDTYIEPSRGMGILVHRTTILKTGVIATGNFI
tara:strand:+ start:2559 stop:5696 length:3138 start_codon:yes stop_codon:yes gene_type:complete